MTKEICILGYCKDTEMILEKSLGSKTKARLYQLETIFTHRLDC